MLFRFAFVFCFLKFLVQGCHVTQVKPLLPVETNSAGVSHQELLLVSPKCDRPQDTRRNLQLLVQLLLVLCLLMVVVKLDPTLVLLLSVALDVLSAEELNMPRIAIGFINHTNSKSWFSPRQNVNQNKNYIYIKKNIFMCILWLTSLARTRDFYVQGIYS